MTSLFGLLTKPLTSTLGAAAGPALHASAMPFEAFLNAARATTSAADSSDDSETEDGNSDSLQDRVAVDLRKLLASLGVDEGDRVQLQVDRESGEITVGNNQPLAAVIQDALKQDKPLADDVRRLAKTNDFFQGSSYKGEIELEIDMGAEQPSDLLQWL